MTLTLSEFLLARIAEDEAAVAVDGGFGPPQMDDTPLTRWDYDQMLIGPKRVLAECRAKRALLTSVPESLMSLHNGPPLLRILAAVYVDHPDYNSNWA